MHEHSDQKCVEGGQIGADQIGILTDKGQTEQHGYRGQQGNWAAIQENKCPEENHRRRQKFDGHRPHYEVDVAFEHQHVQQDVDRVEGRFKSDIETVLMVEHRQQHYSGGSSRKKTEYATFKKVQKSHIGFSVQRPRKDESADNEEHNDAPHAVARTKVELCQAGIRKKKTTRVVEAD